MHQLSKKIIIAAGGTGGHLFPAQALAQDIHKQSPASTVVFLAGGLSTSAYFDRNRFSYHEVPCSPLFSKHPIKLLKGIFNLLKGIRHSIKHLKQIKPDVIVGFGSYYTVPTVLAGKLLRIPIILHEANSVPGKANRLLGSLAHCVALHFPSSSAFFKSKTFHVGCPLREGFRISSIDKEKAMSYYGFTNHKKTLLIFGGSQGAQAINLLIKETIPLLIQHSLQVIHITGNEKIKQELAELYEKNQITACVKSFESQMQCAWKIADFFIGRAGASTIAEAMEFEVPGILIPYPYATENHQQKNSEYLAQTIGGAITLSESNLSSPKLFQHLTNFLSENTLSQMKTNLQNYKNRPHQMTLFDLVMKFDF
ncbi:MAG: undecaprenyldiphospho-muramoylpentapeptide beta-N-acetylglucosaminyltransferase [Parachlamydiaceae bacterium]|nr:undecaprenyldiphospho-muramoylpentapeptide beta-N-acetylglucosaminyltransferase [Parachlamydiaceae bacterium]